MGKIEVDEFETEAFIGVHPDDGRVALKVNSIVTVDPLAFVADVLYFDLDGNVLGPVVGVPHREIVTANKTIVLSKDDERIAALDEDRS